MSISTYARYPSGDRMGELLPDNTTSYYMQGTLWILEVLHVYWGFLILKMVKKAILSGGTEDDIRNVEDKTPKKVKTN
jgi:hypothetical protein